MRRVLQKLFVRDYTAVFTIMTIGAAVGLLASFVLSVEAITLAKDSGAVLSCDLNTALSCGAVGRHPSAALLGFPNAFIGLVSFAVMLTVAVAGLMGTRFPKLFMFLAWLGGVAGLLFATWMFLTSFFVISTLCPWCLATDVATLMVLWALTRYAVGEDTLRLPRKWQKVATHAVTKQYDTVAVVTVVIVAFVAIIAKFGSQLF